MDDWLIQITKRVTDHMVYEHQQFQGKPFVHLKNKFKFIIIEYNLAANDLPYLIIHCGSDFRTIK